MTVVTYELSGRERKKRETRDRITAGRPSCTHGRDFLLERDAGSDCCIFTRQASPCAGIVKLSCRLAD